MTDATVARCPHCPYSFILDAIMRSEDGDQVVQTIHASLRQVAADLEANRVPLEKFVISKVTFLIDHVAHTHTRIVESDQGSDSLR